MRDLDVMTSCVDGQGQEDGLAIYQAVCELLITSGKFTWECLPASLLPGAAVLARGKLGNLMSAQAVPLFRFRENSQGPEVPMLWEQLSLIALLSFTSLDHALNLSRPLIRYSVAQECYPLSLGSEIE